MRRPLTSLLWYSALFCGVVLSVHAQNSDDRAIVVSRLQARLAWVVPAVCDRDLAGAIGGVQGWVNEASKAGERKEEAYGKMMAAPLGYGLVGHYAAKMNRARRDQKGATEQAENLAAEVPAVRARTVDCRAGIPLLRADLQASLADPVKLDRAVERLRLTRQDVRTAVTVFAKEAQGVGSGLLDGSQQRERVDRLQQQWEHLQPRLASEYVPPTQTASLNSLLGAVVAVENAVRFVQFAEDQVAALTVDLAAAQRRLTSKASLMERGLVDQHAYNINNARRELAIARRTLEGKRESLTHALTGAARLSEASH